MDVKLHSTGVIFDDRLWMSCQIIQELGDLFGFFVICFGFFKGDVIEGNQKSVVQFNSIVEKCTTICWMRLQSLRGNKYEESSGSEY